MITKALNVLNKAKPEVREFFRTAFCKLFVLNQNHHSWVLKGVKQKVNRFLHRHQPKKSYSIPELPG